ncbi:unnamed protein product [Callosobruchus maculatus]|uniref:FCP1 homology domain-containing protein n=1 Tax=Callosobruchus maculatus TaxID=64391 RepID=A0A653C143_CALMS|nr:unnamed protein product [Callosobruchus maculatus]
MVGTIKIQENENKILQEDILKMKTCMDKQTTSVVNKGLNISRFEDDEDIEISDKYTAADVMCDGHPKDQPSVVELEERNESVSEILEVDSLGSKVQCYPEVPETLKYLHEKGYPFAVASRCTDNKGCRTLLNLFGWDQYFKYLEIYPGRKFKHFNRIKEASGVDYSEMIFFDDEHRNIDDMTSIGVHSVFVPEGLTKKLVQDSIDKFYQNK